MTIKNTQTPTFVKLHLELERQPHHCPSCGTLTTKVHDYRQQKIRHIQIFGLETKTFY
ncbi:hypothetical protein CEY16_07635 [Halalkalibacillus sediminis]|uniref:Transposase IS204/IS1001/IS1096/IS1165 zinc-finger domain-containing protein n=1 Tax=Halalkalibacillus sediminis TaxID=2018042 RepID=A0A2I0QU16_9BACI|nr:hypothetical protein CEY16_07635 [Halalkalibacillus sediminis]